MISDCPFCNAHACVAVSFKNPSRKRLHCLPSVEVFGNNIMKPVIASYIGTIQTKILIVNLYHMQSCILVIIFGAGC